MCCGARNSSGLIPSGSRFARMIPHLAMRPPDMGHPTAMILCFRVCASWKTEPRFAQESPVGTAIKLQQIIPHHVQREMKRLQCVDPIDSSFQRIVVHCDAVTTSVGAFVPFYGHKYACIHFNRGPIYYACKDSEQTTFRVLFDPQSTSISASQEISWRCLRRRRCGGRVGRASAGG